MGTYYRKPVQSSMMKVVLFALACMVIVRGSSGSGCTNADKNCDYWAGQGLCNNNEHKQFMQESCQKACKLCGGGGGGPTLKPECSYDMTCRALYDDKTMCDQRTYRCVECVETGDCIAIGAKCLDYRCFDCVTDSDCSSNAFCFVGQNKNGMRCYEKLITGATCIINNWCASGTCTDNVCA